MTAPTPWPHTDDCDCDPMAGEPTDALGRLILGDLQRAYGEVRVDREQITQPALADVIREATRD